MVKIRNIAVLQLDTREGLDWGGLNLNLNFLNENYEVLFNISLIYFYNTPPLVHLMGGTDGKLFLETIITMTWRYQSTPIKLMCMEQ